MRPLPVLISLAVFADVSAFSRRAPQVLYLYRGTVDGQIRLDTLLRGEGRDRDAEDGSSSYETSASAVKGVVSSLTTIANSIFDQSSREITINTENSNSPSSPQELMKRIGAEYTENNYLWTGNIDSSSFAADCTFTDPTLSFQGVDKFVSNVQNLVPVVDFLLEGKTDENSESVLLDIRLNEEESYVETRWNMVGSLKRLPWRPKIDVIGRTKFWYETELRDDDSVARVQVNFYDEQWEIPAGLALMQLITPPGTIRNSDLE
mmetsp:Transcript_35410/g.84568  ORF Transcript_35410/g.84568 Transcript_35410/m.84568 type:complete len:263 (+) Transcript_35410:88-876(+)